MNGKSPCSGENHSRRPLTSHSRDGESRGLEGTPLAVFDGGTAARASRHRVGRRTSVREFRDFLFRGSIIELAVGLSSPRRSVQWSRLWSRT